MEISAVLSGAISAYHTYNRFEETPELFQLKHKIEQLIPIVESVQILSKKDPVVFAPALEKTIVTLRDCKALIESNAPNIHALLKSDNLNSDLKQLTKDIGDIIKEMTLAVVALNTGVCAPPWTPKVTLVGPSVSGKTSFLTYWQNHVFKQEIPTVGASVMKLTPSPSCQLDVWDTAGQEKYMGLSEMYLKGANIVILVFSLIDANRKPLNEWYELIKKNMSPGTVLGLVGTKLDLVGKENKGKCDWGKKFAASSNMLYFEISAKTGENVEHCVFRLFSRLRPQTSSSRHYDEKSVISTSGFLYKVPGDRGNKIGGWQERYFIYDTNDLQHVYYYKSQKDFQKGKTSGQIILSEVQTVKSGEDITMKPNSFIVSTPGRTWYFYAKTPEEQKKWINMFKQALA